VFQQDEDHYEFDVWQIVLGVVAEFVERVLAVVLFSRIEEPNRNGHGVQCSTGTNEHPGYSSSSNQES
jgi:hypothetical protein